MARREMGRLFAVFVAIFLIPVTAQSFQGKIVPLDGSFPMDISSRALISDNVNTYLAGSNFGSTSSPLWKTFPNIGGENLWETAIYTGSQPPNAPAAATGRDDNSIFWINFGPNPTPPEYIVTTRYNSMTVEQTGWLSLGNYVWYPSYKTVWSPMHNTFFVFGFNSASGDSAFMFAVSKTNVKMVTFSSIPLAFTKREDFAFIASAATGSLYVAGGTKYELWKISLVDQGTFYTAEATMLSPLGLDSPTGLVWVHPALPGGSALVLQNGSNLTTIHFGSINSGLTWKSITFTGGCTTTQGKVYSATINAVQQGFLYISSQTTICLYDLSAVPAYLTAQSGGGTTGGNAGTTGSTGSKAVAGTTGSSIAGSLATTNLIAGSLATTNLIAGGSLGSTTDSGSLSLGTTNSLGGLSLGSTTDSSGTLSLATTNSLGGLSLGSTTDSLGGLSLGSTTDSLGGLSLGTTDSLGGLSLGTTNSLGGLSLGSTTNSLEGLSLGSSTQSTVNLAGGLSLSITTVTTARLPIGISSTTGLFVPQILIITPTQLNVVNGSGTVEISGNIDLKDALENPCTTTPKLCETAVTLKPAEGGTFNGSLAIPIANPEKVQTWWLNFTVSVTSSSAGTWVFELIKENSQHIQVANSTNLRVDEWTSIQSKPIEGDISLYYDNAGSFNVYIYYVRANGRRDDADSEMMMDTMSLQTCDGTEEQCFASGEVEEESPAKEGKDNKLLYIVIPIAGFVFLVIVVLVIILIAKRNSKNKYTSRRDSQAEVELKPLQIPEIKNVTVGRRLGAGNFGEVFQGIAWGTTTVALKKLRKELMDEFLMEANILSKLKHPNCVLFLGVYTEPSTDERFIVTEFCQNGSLSDWLQLRADKLKADELLELALGAAKGMTYLESCNIVHRDLSARNLLVDGNGNVKVADFGLSRSVDNNYYESSGAKFPVRWTAPEVIKFSKYSSKSDTWSMAITLWEIMTYGQLPYNGLKNEEVMKKVVDEGFRLQKPPGCLPEVWNLITDCWKEKPADRPLLCEVAQRLTKLVNNYKPDVADLPIVVSSGKKEIEPNIASGTYHTQSDTYNNNSSSGTGFYNNASADEIRMHIKEEIPDPTDDFYNN